MESSDDDIAGERTRTPTRVRGEEPFREEEGPDERERERENGAERAEEEAPHVPSQTQTPTSSSLPLFLGVPGCAGLGVARAWIAHIC